MVVKPLVVAGTLAGLAGLAGLAAAEPVLVAEDPPEATSSAISRFGYRLGAGSLPLDGRSMFVFSVGVGVEHPLAGRTRVLAEYEWLWLERRDPAGRMSPPDYGDGHRLHLGLRHVLADKQLRTIRLWIDGELGGGVALVTDNLSGVRTVPDGFAGLRFGYDLRVTTRSPSHVFAAELLVRAIAIDRGVGVMGGVGMSWGD